MTADIDRRVADRCAGCAVALGYSALGLVLAAAASLPVWVPLATYLGVGAVFALLSVRHSQRGRT